MLIHASIVYFQTFSLFILDMNGLIFRIKDNADHAELSQQLLVGSTNKGNYYLNIYYFK